MRAQHYAIEELMPPCILAAKGEAWCWQRLNRGLLLFLDQLWQDAQIQFGAGKHKVVIEINNWKWGGARKYSGWRPADCTEGAEYSYHKDGNAVDLRIYRIDKNSGKRTQIPPNDVNQYVLRQRDMQRPAYQWVRCYESGNGMTWSHYDGRNYDGVLHIPLNLR